MATLIFNDKQGGNGRSPNVTDLDFMLGLNVMSQIPRLTDRAVSADLHLHKEANL